MSWRDGCHPWPAAARSGEGGFDFDFDRADELGRRLDHLRITIEANLDARADGQRSLVSWMGGHRRSYDNLRRWHEASLAGAEVVVLIAHLRALWDAAAERFDGGPGDEG